VEDIIQYFCAKTIEAIQEVLDDIETFVSERMGVQVRIMVRCKARRVCTWWVSSKEYFMPCSTDTGKSASGHL
jgi:hypothetical protein